MKNSSTWMFVLGIAALTAASNAQFETRVVAKGLNRPTGLTVMGFGTFTSLVYSQVPTPGVSGAAGGTNGIFKLDLWNNRKWTINMGEPEPLNLTATSDGSIYWTCRSAGVILKRNKVGMIAPLLTGLAKPTGITALANGDIAFTQVPTPGVNGMNGGMNRVDLFTGGSVMNITMGEPEPTDIVASRSGDLYWTCKSAGVILHRNPAGMVEVVLRGLNKPTGIAINKSGSTIYFTEVPTPGFSSRMGGGNFVWEYNLARGTRTIVSYGDSEPTDVAVTLDGRIFWTNSASGEILEARRTPFGI